MPKKLADASPNMYLWTTSPVDIKALMPDRYMRLTADDFIAGGTAAHSNSEHKGGLPGGGAAASAYIVKNYNADTGILTFTNPKGRGEDPAYGSQRWCECQIAGTIFAVYRGTIGGVAQ